MARRPRVPFRFKTNTPAEKKEVMTKEEAIRALVQERVAMHPAFLPASPMTTSIPMVNGPQEMDIRGLTKRETLAMQFVVTKFPQSAFGPSDDEVRRVCFNALHWADLFLEMSDRAKQVTIDGIIQEVTDQMDKRLTALREEQSAVVMREVDDDDDPLGDD